MSLGRWWTEEGAADSLSAVHERSNNGQEGTAVETAFSCLAVPVLLRDGGYS